MAGVTSMKLVTSVTGMKCLTSVKCFLRVTMNYLTGELFVKYGLSDRCEMFALRVTMNYLTGELRAH